MTYRFVEVEERPPAAVIRFNRPERKNAFTSELMDEARLALAGFEVGGEVRGLVLAGAGGTFSTGADLNEAVALDTGAASLKWNRHWRELGRTIERHTLPVVAAVEGYCLTGGLEVALACDLRVAAQDARFGITSARIGSVAGAGGTQRLPRLIGVARAKELLFTADFIGADEALAMGLVNRVVPAGEAERAAVELVERFASRGPLSLWWAKWAVNQGMEMPLDAALDWEASLSAHAFATEDKQEGMRAFLDKREPRFRGR